MPEVILDHGRRWFGNGGDPGYPKIHGGRSRSSIRQVSRSRRRRLGSQGGSASRTTLATAVSSCCAAATGSHNLACAIVPE
jgi:hypothetical protein